jgi:RHS repeat-associated protein
VRPTSQVRCPAGPDSAQPGGGTIVVTYVHGNHLGVPLSITDSAGNAATTPNDYLAPAFPGQSKTLPDLYYNRYRDYDPTTGRYIQADPIGLAGGQNDYLYAGANPVRWSDPLGKNAALLGGEMGGSIGGPAGAAIGATIGGGFMLCLAMPSCRDAILPPKPAPAPPPDNARKGDCCKPYYDEIQRRLNEVRRRLDQFRKDSLGLPLVNPPGVKGRTRTGEAQAFYDAQAGLRRAIKAALDAGCKEIPPDAWLLATMPLDDRFPRPIGKYRQ